MQCDAGWEIVWLTRRVTAFVILSETDSDFAFETASEQRLKSEFESDSLLLIRWEFPWQKGCLSEMESEWR